MSNAARKPAEIEASLKKIAFDAAVAASRINSY
jgi:hypothetical protein